MGVSLVINKVRSRLLESFGCITEAVAYIHHPVIRHKDLKPSQILLSPHGLRLADFGWSADVSDFSQSATSGDDRITTKYQAPERANMQPCGRSEDIFALGCVFLEISTQTAIDPGYPTLDLPWSQKGWSFQANLEKIYSLLEIRLRTSSFAH
jgi:serine/threonine protein kinase